MELVRGTNKTEIKNAHRQEHIRRRQQDTPQAEICPEQAAERSQAEICPEQAAGCSIGRNISGGGRGTSTGGSRTLTGRDMSGAGRGTSTGGSRTLTGRDMSGGGSRILHRQRYVRRRQQDTPQAGIYRRRQQETAGDTTGNTQAGIYRRRQQNIKRSKKNK